MPHDRKGNLVEVGDKVIIPCTVKNVSVGDDYCNCTVETDEVMQGNGTTNTYSLNTKQVEKL